MGRAGAEYRYAGGSAVFENVFLPPEFDPGAATLWAVHLGAIVSPLSAAEAGLVSTLNEANPQLVLHRTRVAHIDYADFELQGDYREFCRRASCPVLGRPLRLRAPLGRRTLSVRQRCPQRRVDLLGGVLLHARHHPRMRVHVRDVKHA